MSARPRKAIKKPVDIEYWQFTGWSTAVALLKWITVPAYFVPRGYEHPMRKEHEFDGNNGHILDDAPSFLVIPTLEGDMRADELDYIIKGVQGEFYPCKPDIFEATYDKVEQ